MTSTPTKSPQRKRLLAVSLLLFALFAILIAKFYQVQIVEGDKWSKIADRQHYFIVKDPFLRGTFISNTAIKKGHPEAPQSLVTDVQYFHLFADPESIAPPFRPGIVAALSDLLQLDSARTTTLNDNLEKKSRSRKLAMWLDKETHDSVLAWWGPYSKKHKIPRNALFFTSDYKRSYPFGKLLGQVMHTIQGVKDEKTGQALPTGGLELSLDKYLRGKPGKRRLLRSPRNSLETGEVLSVPENGADIYLTINHCLQAIAEEELEKGVKSSKAKSGWAVMMDPFTGEVLALAQYPFFTPEEYQRYFNDPALIENTKVKAITDANEPGSTIKEVTIAIALKANDELVSRGEAPLFDPEAKMPTSDPHFYGRRKPLKDTHFHSFLNMHMAIQKSSNIYVARLAEKIVQRLGKEWYRQALYDDFGFGQKTGIELPSESCGLLPRIGKKHPNGTFEWSVSTPYSLAMGHNVQVTSLQMARAYAVFANGGYLVRPTIVRKIARKLPSGEEETLFENPLADAGKRRVISEKRAQEMITALKFTTKVGGTARRADVWGYTECGKTGTADKVKNGKYDPHYVCASFVGIVPANSPSFVLVVTMDEPEYGYEAGVGRKHMGGTCAAPVFREIAKRSLEYLGIPPDDPYGYPPGDPRYDKDKADWLPELRQLQEKYEKWNNSGSGH